MEAEVLLSELDTERVFDQIADALTEKGYVVIPAALPIAMSDALFARIASFEDEVFKPAGVGRAGEFQLNPFVRNDEIRWLAASDEVEASYSGVDGKITHGIESSPLHGLIRLRVPFCPLRPRRFL